MFIFIQPENLVYLKQLKLVFTPALALQDPFIENKRVHRPVSQQPLSDSEFSAAMQKNYDALEAHIKAMVSFDYYLQQAKQNRPQIEAQLKQQQQVQNSEAVIATREQYSKVAVLRLFRSIHQQALWEKYGNDHAGVAIKVHSDHPFFSDASFNGKPQLTKAIEYDDARPSAPTKQQPFPALIRRPEHFAYEQEWRLIRPISSFDSANQDVLTAKLPKGLVEGIYLGLHADADLISSMRNLVAHDLQFRGVPLKQLGVSETHLRLVATTLD